MPNALWSHHYHNVMAGCRHCAFSKERRRRKVFDIFFRKSCQSSSGPGKKKRREGICVSKRKTFYPIKTINPHFSPCHLKLTSRKKSACDEQYGNQKYARDTRERRNNNNNNNRFAEGKNTAGFLLRERKLERRVQRAGRKVGRRRKVAPASSFSFSILFA